MTIQDMHPVLYGVWTPGIGWLRGKETRVYCTPHKVIAERISRRLGGNSRAEFIDEALGDGVIEERLRQTEKQTKWHISTK